MRTNKFASGNVFVYVCSLETKNIYCHTDLTYAARKVITNFSPGQFPETGLLFFGPIS